MFLKDLTYSIEQNKVKVVCDTVKCPEVFSYEYGCFVLYNQHNKVQKRKYTLYLKVEFIIFLT